MPMNKRFVCVVVLLIVAGAASAATRDDVRQALSDYLISHHAKTDRSPVNTGILADAVLPLAGLDRYNGSSDAPDAEFETWLQAASELRRASLFESSIHDPKDFRASRQLAQHNDVHPLNILLYDYNQVKSGTERDKVIQFDGKLVTGVSADAFETRRAFLFAPEHDWTYHGSAVEFTFAPGNLFTNLQGDVQYDIDFADGRGFVALEPVMHVQYTSVGEKQLTVRATTGEGLHLFARSRFQVRHLDAPPPSETWPLTASHSTGGPAATGEAYILYAPGHTMVTRPVVLVEGLDLDNSRNWNELYDLMNQELLIETLLQIGFDAVVLNYGNSTMPVQDNAYLVQELIEELNSATGAVYPMVIVGTSLGGLTTRFALTYMEHNNLPHNVETFISVDSPQNGANIPIGIQFWADFFAGESAEAQAARDALLTPAPRQMLLYHLSSSGAGTANPDPQFAAFQNELASLGDYPQLPRLVSVINGSSTQQNSGFNPGAQIIRWVYNSFLVNIRGNVWGVSNTVNTRVLQGEINVIWPFPDTFRDVYIQPCLPWDNAPGGLTATMAELAATPAPYGTIEALYPSHCFIPSVSALDLNVNDPFFNIASAGNLYDLTPFDSVYYPVANQDHVQITPENAAWFIDEIVGPLEAPVVTVIADADNVYLNWTPVFAALNYQVESSPDAETWSPLTTTSATTLTLAATEPLAHFRVIAAR